jgi:hypothetical protein
MSRNIPFAYNEYCDICNIRGAYDFMGDYLCEKCYRADLDDAIYEDDFLDETYESQKNIDENLLFKDYPDYKENCPCGECRCGKKEESIHNWLM